MPGRVHITVDIEVETGSDPIRGRLRAPVSTPPRPFVGWLQLVALIDQAWRAASDDVDDPPGASPPHPPDTRRTT